jgi:hypothetical protein
MLGLAAVVAVITQLIQVGLLYVLFRDLSAVEQQFGPEPGLTEIVDQLASSLGSFVVATVLTWLATLLLTGVLTVVVGHAVLGRPCSVGEAWRQAAPRLPRLLLVALLVGLIVTLPLLVVAGLLALAALADPPAWTLILVGLLFLPAGLVSAWLYVRLALASPALVLETTPAGRPMGVAGALRRSVRLVTGAWWRTFGILLLVTVLVAVISQILALPFAAASLFFTDFESTGTPSLAALSFQALGGVVASIVTTPFSAAVTVLLYVDRRIRREGLDIELARAAGVVIPGRMPPA